MKNKNYKQSVLLSLLLLFFGYLLVRYVLLDLHKMKDWPTILFISSFVVIVVCFFMKKLITPLVTSISYIIGFFIGFVFQTNGMDQGGGTTNNLWMIWTITIFVLFIVSIIVELMINKKSN